jgi:hypothetical protein
MSLVYSIRTFFVSVFSGEVHNGLGGEGDLALVGAEEDAGSGVFREGRG